MDDLRVCLSRAGIEAEESSLQKLRTYEEMLLEWNGRMDLTSVSGADTAQRHFLDSLMPLETPGLIPQGCRLIDVGSGAGFPGLPLGIVRPDLRVTLLEAQGKRCRFLRAVCDALALSNVRIVQDRAEIAGQMAEHRERYDRAVARAVAPLNLLCEYLLPFVKVGGMALCWKGPAAAAEMRDGAAAARVLGGEIGETRETPAGDTRHILVCIHKNQKTLPQYPRKNGIPAKRPLKCEEK